MANYQMVIDKSVICKKIRNFLSRPADNKGEGAVHIKPEVYNV